MNKRSIQQTTYYSAIKKNEALTPATMWVNLKTGCEVKAAKHKRLYDSIDVKCPE